MRQVRTLSSPFANTHKLNSDSLFETRAVMQPFVLAGLLVTSALHTLSGLNRDAANLVLVMLRAALVGVFVMCSKSRSNSARDALFTPPDHRAILDSLPRDVRTAISRLKLQPNVVRYATCPSCCQIYPPNPSFPNDPYPRECTYRETDKPVCGASLVRPVKFVEGGQPQVKYTPRRPYPYRSVFSWIANVFSRAALEPVIGSAWEDTIPSSGGRWTDIMQAPALRDFLGPNGKPYSQQYGTDVHLVFGLFIDWFNPGGNKKAGKSRSIGAIYLVCFNIPPHLRYRPENICLVGIIPGPNEPALHQLNHLLRPLINEMLVLWSNGIRLTQTALHSNGRLVRAVIIPLICDLPALRKTTGFAGHSSKHMCSFCLLKKGNINDLNRPWPERSRKDHENIARRWRDARTEKERDEIFEKHGLRWSVLLDLPYWDPTRFAVVDAMHNLFLGELRHHCMEVWGIYIKDKAPTKKLSPHTPKEQRKWLDHIVTSLRKKSLSSLLQPCKGYLVALAQLNGISPHAKLTKQEYALALMRWVCLRGCVHRTTHAHHSTY